MEWVNLSAGWYYAALTPATKLCTSPDNCSACLDRSCAAVSTWPAAEPVSLAASLTPLMLTVMADSLRAYLASLPLADIRTGQRKAAA